MAQTYNPAVFDVEDIPTAKSVILTPEDSTTDQRWSTETPYLADLIGQWITITPESLVLDYGCGIGRMAKELIVRHGCRVIGVDISRSMRALGHMYVASDRFLSCPPAMLDGLVERGIRFDAAISVWVLQHCENPAEDIARIRRALRPDGEFAVVNSTYRAIPTPDRNWTNDGIDLLTEVSREFTLLDTGKLAPEHVSANVAKNSFWAAFRSR